MRVPDACRMLGIGRSKLYELIAEGEIPTLKLGSSTLLPVAGIKAFVARLGEG
nr:helix-turn-helix domain-containing protein [Sphingobium yanoikuyae]